MGGMSAMSYSPEQMPQVFRKLGTNQGKEETAPSTAEIGQAKFKGNKEERGFYILSREFAARSRKVRAVVLCPVIRIRSRFFRSGRPRPGLLFGLGFQHPRCYSRTGGKEKEDVMRETVVILTNFYCCHSDQREESASPRRTSYPPPPCQLQKAGRPDPLSLKISSAVP
jgi:hypothetical protein